jgi:membrane fusion protein (multidrug efflux system)
LGILIEYAGPVSTACVWKKIVHSWKERKPEWICGLICIVVIVSVARILIHRKLYIDSDNATLQGYAIALSSEVEGEVLHVYVTENQAVRKGQILCVLEDSRWLARLGNAEAKRDALRARWETARRDEARANFLIHRHVISPSASDHANTEAQSLFDQMKAAEAGAAQALTNFRRTRILAPDDGSIAFRTARPGMLAQVGMPLFGFVDRKDRWVLAKVRETDIPDMHIGQAVQVTFDSAPGRKFKGKIESFSPSTEHTFYSAVPADFSAGNFTKYVQWYPIRVQVALSEADEARIPVGASSTVLMSRN